MSRRVLVLGGTGFVGGAVARALLARGDRVVVVGRGGRPAPAGAESRNADRSDRDSMARALEGKSFDVTLDFSAYDRDAIESLLEYPRFEAGRFVAISTGQVCLVGSSPRRPYVEADGDAPLIPEPALTSPDHGQWSYGVGKRGVEAAVAEARTRRSLEALVLRLPVILGADDSSLRTWAYLERILDGGPLLLPEPKEQPVRFLWVDDVARAVDTILDRWPLPNPVYHLAQPQVLPLWQAIEQLAAAAGRTLDGVDVDEPTLALAGLDGACSPYSGRWVSVLDPGRAQQEWGFKATPFEGYVGDVVRAHLQRRPHASHPGYHTRPAEIALARALKDRGAMSR